jgi:hypothetical protein
MNTRILSIFAVIICLSACGSDENSYSFMNHLTFYASFDSGFDADFSTGDPNLYAAPALSQAQNGYTRFDPVTGRQFAQIIEGEGRYENALKLDLPYEPILFYRGAENQHFQPESFSGSVSFWMRLDAAELAPGYSDPIQITSRGWNDGALFVDFTDLEPRIFRFAIFPDREIWDPDFRDWDEVPAGERPMVDIADHPFTDNEWHHVAFTFQNFNTGSSDGVVTCYLNGEPAGTLTDREMTFTWNPENLLIWLGYNFRGYLDEISIYNTNLSDEEIRSVYQLQHPIIDLLEGQNLSHES